MREAGVVPGLPHPQILDDIPALLARVARALELPPQAKEAVVAGPAEDHAEERWHEGSDVREVTAEYTLLRTTILRLYGEQPDAVLRVEDVVRLDEVVDAALAQAVAFFARASAQADESLAQLDALLDAVPAGIAFVDPELRFRRVNAMLAREAGRTRESYVGKALGTILPEFGRIVRPLFERALASGEETQTLEFDDRGTSGRRRSWLASAFPVRARDGTSLGAGGVLLDITARKRVEEVQAFFVEAARWLPESLDEDTTLERLARLVVEHLADYCILDLLDAQGRLYRAWSAVSASGPEQRAQVQRLTSFPPQVGSESPLARVLATREPLLLEEVTPALLDAMALDAEHRAVLAALAPRSACVVPLVARGRTLGLISLAATQRSFGQEDLEVAKAVADRAAVALDNARLHQELRASEARLLAILENTPSPIFVKDREGRYLLINPAFERAVGLDSAQLVGRDDLAIYPQATAEAVRANDAEVVRSGRALVFEEVIPQRDGPHTYLSVKFPLPGSDGQPTAACGIATDITDRKRAEEELRHTAEFRERFIGVVSHDLRNPLNAITMSADLLLRAGGTPPGVERMVRRIAASAERMRRMIEDLLDFTRVRLGAGLPLTFRRLDVREVVRTVLDEAAVSAPSRDIVVTEEGSLVGEWDADRLAQMLGNLVKNALDYSPEDTPIRVSLRGTGGEVSLEVHNESEPIPPEVLATLFDPFRSAAETRRRSKGGLGLGLYIAREICAAHGGHIEVSSTAEEGTTFRVRLPRRPPATAPAWGAAAQPPAPGP